MNDDDVQAMEQDMSNDDSTPIFDAVLAADTGKLKHALASRSSFDISERNKDNFTALHLAVLNNNFDMVNLLLKYSAYQDDTCLLVAARTGNLELVKLLLSDRYTSDLHAVSKDYFTPLHFAVKNHEDEIAEYLLAKRANPNVQDSSGCTPLHLAVVCDCAKNHSSLITLLLSHGADPNIQNHKLMNSPFHYYLMSDKEEDLLDYFFANNVDITLQNNNGTNALECAVIFGSLEILKKIFSLIGNECDTTVHRSMYHQYIASAITRNQISEEMILKIVRFLVENKTTLNVSEIEYTGLLFLAASMGYENIVGYLLSLGADINQGEDWEPLKGAAISGRSNMIKFLINRGARANLTNILNLAIDKVDEQSRYEVMKLLLDRGAEANDVDDSSICEKALILNDTKVFRLLIERGASVTTKNGDDETLLHIACRMQDNSSKYEVIKCLIDFGVDVNHSNVEEVSPLAIAVKQNDEKLFLFLLNNGAYSHDDVAFKLAVQKGLLNFVKILAFVYGLLVDHSMYSSHFSLSFEEHQPRILLFLLDLEFNSRFMMLGDIVLVNLLSDLYNEDKEHEYEEEIKVVLLNLALRKSENYEIPFHLDEVEFFENLLEFYNEEIERMKNKKITDKSSLTYYDFLAKCGNALVRCLNNTDVRNALDTGAYREFFPSYSSRIEVHYLNGLIRQRMLKEFESVLSSIFENVFPNVVIRVLSKYFNYVEFHYVLDKSVVYSFIKS